MSISRRSWLHALGMSATVVGFDPAESVWVTQAEANTVAIPILDGHLTLDPLSRRAAATDWGKAVSRQPFAILRPGSIADIVKWSASAGCLVLKSALAAKPIRCMGSHRWAAE